MKNTILKKLNDIRQQAFMELDVISDLEAAQNFKNKYLSRKGIVQSMLQEMKSLDANDRPLVGKDLNELKGELQDSIASKIENISKNILEEKISTNRIDITLPGRIVKPGYRHPICQTTEKVVEVFTDMGFSIYEGPDIESDYYNFEALNF